VRQRYSTHPAPAARSATGATTGSVGITVVPTGRSPTPSPAAAPTGKVAPGSFGIPPETSGRIPVEHSRVAGAVSARKRTISGG
jgi:hypothetical protein